MPRGDVEAEARAILAAAERDIRYTDDPLVRRPDAQLETHDLVQAPIVTLETRAGDCVAFAGLIAAGLQSVGRVVRYTVTATRPGMPRHITVEVQGPGGWFTLDPVPQPHRVGYGAALPGAEMRSWSPTGEPLPLGAVCVQPAGGSGMGDVAEDLATIREAAISTDLGQAVADKVELAMPALDQIASVSAAVASGDPTGLETADAIMNGVSGALAFAGPYGAIIAAVARALWALGKWLVQTYPAEAIMCSNYVANDLPGKEGWTGPYAAGEYYRDAGMLFVASYQQKIDALHDWEFFNTGETYMGARFDIGTAAFEGRRWDDFLRMCAPGRTYSTPRPPGVGYRTWQEWAAAHPDLPVTLASDEALDRIAHKVRDRLAAGGIAFFEFTHGDHCRISGYSFPVSALPDSTLLEVVRRMMEFAEPAEDDEARDPDLLDAAMAEEPIPPGADLPEGSFIRYGDGLSGAILHYQRISPFKDYTFAALLMEYKRRRDSGTLRDLGPREVAPAEPAFAAAPRTMTLAPRLPAAAPRVSAAAPAEAAETADEAAAAARPVQVLPAQPGAAAAAMPEAIPQGVSTEEAMVLAAIRYQDSVRQAMRADAAARAYYGGMSGCGSCAGCSSCGGLGAELPRLVDLETEAEIAGRLGTAAELLARTDLRTRARQSNYGLSHVGEASMSRSRAADRLMAYKKAAGIEPVDSVIDESVRTALAEDGGFPIGAVPTLAELAAKVGTVAVAAAEPVMVSPPGTYEPEPGGGAPAAPAAPPMISALPRTVAPLSPLTPSGLPAAAPPSGAVPAATGPAPSAEVPATTPPATSEAFPTGAPGGAVMVAPPGSAEVTVRTKTDPTVLYILLLGLWMSARRRRA